VPRRLPRSFFARDVLDVAPALLGCTITRGPVTVRLTEVEAYAGYLADPGSHAYRGRTPRTKPMFGPAGFTYVYFTYGMHWCLNLVTGPVGAASAVLVRAGEVVGGHDVAATRRPGVAPRDWCRGPARLAATLGLSGVDSGRDFCTPPLVPDDRRSDLVVRSAVTPTDPARRRTGPRVGVAGAGGDVTAYPWRFWLDGEPTVSVYRPAKPRVRRTPR
jgi:DNA-3-methyladenine glycosylase